MQLTKWIDVNDATVLEEKENKYCFFFCILSLQARYVMLIKKKLKK